MDFLILDIVALKTESCINSLRIFRFRIAKYKLVIFFFLLYIIRISANRDNSEGGGGHGDSKRGYGTSVLDSEAICAAGAVQNR